MRRRALLGLAAGGVALFRLSRVAAKPFTDAAGREVDLPDRVERVFAAGPPASLILFMVAPEKMLGWARAPAPKARAFLPQRYAALPETGRLTGRGNTVHFEDLVKLAPDLVLDVGSTTPTYVSLAAEVERRTHIPEVLIGGRLAETPETLRRVGALLGAAARAEALARYAETVLAAIRRGVAPIAADRRPSIYVARGPRGLESAVAGSLGSEVVDLLGARNVVGPNAGTRAIVDVSAEADPRQATRCDPGHRPALSRRDRRRPGMARGTGGPAGTCPFCPGSAVLVARRAAGTQPTAGPPLARPAALSCRVCPGYAGRDPPLL